MTDQTLDTHIPDEMDEALEGEIIIAENVTFEEFLTRFSEQHTEWIDGKVILLTMSNNTPHQAILFVLSTLFGMFLGARKLGQVLLAGVPMRLVNVTPKREPDILIVLNEHADRIKLNHLDGAADIVVEIVSPESTDRDRGRKFREYEAGGVPEYWLIDPLRTEAVVYVLGDDARYHPNPLDSEGRLNSHVLLGFAIHPNVLWNAQPFIDDNLIELVRQMTVQS
jgi:Uma2 family endonuclease